MIVFPCVGCWYTTVCLSCVFFVYYPLTKITWDDVPRWASHQIDPGWCSQVTRDGDARGVLSPHQIDPGWCSHVTQDGVARGVLSDYIQFKSSIWKNLVQDEVLSKFKPSPVPIWKNLIMHEAFLWSVAGLFLWLFRPRASGNLTPLQLAVTSGFSFFRRLIVCLVVNSFACFLTAARA